MAKTYLADYTPHPFVIEHAALDFSLDPHRTRVRSRLTIRRQTAGSDALVLDGEKMSLEALAIDGAPLPQDRYLVDDRTLTIRDVPDSFVLEVDNIIAPAENTALTGLYMSGGRFCSQCESEGFRRITYFIDRPDNLSRFTVRVEADRDAFPTLLSNGDMTESGDAGNGRHFASFEDPHPKPSYLFALVAGTFDRIADTFTTMSGKNVDLFIHVDPGDADKAYWAMDVLKRSMAWDEKVFAREYDLSVFHIVAVRDFNFGAMENKGLNVFNSSLLLASPEAATDADFHGVERVVAHEYFHNWSGNRITLRDWFQLSLKEGLTVYRDQEFSADQGSPSVQRIRDVETLRGLQFPEDAGPLAHPIRLDAYEAIENFYTPTVYRKGAEVIRVLREIIGRDTFNAGVKRYFETNDGTAATLEDFIAAFEAESGRKLDDFFDWYQQAGTPRLSFSGKYDAQSDVFDLTVRQKTLPTPGQDEKKPLPVPLRIGFISGKDGSVLSARRGDENEAREEHTPLLSKAEETYRFEGLGAEPIASILRGFNAPVIVEESLSTGDRLMQMAHEPDPFTRWDAGQSLITDAILARAGGRDEGALVAGIVTALKEELGRAAADMSFAANAFNVPGLGNLIQAGDAPDPEALYQARVSVMADIAKGLEADLAALLDTPSNDPADHSVAAAGLRGMRVRAMHLLAAAGERHASRLGDVFGAARGMSEMYGALHALAQIGGAVFDTALAGFYERWSGDELVLDKWFSVQATSPLDGAVERIHQLANHEKFTLKTPNRVRSVYGAFGNGNLRAFHAADGSGYELIAEAIRTIDPANPMLAGRLARSFESWHQIEEGRRKKAQGVLEGLATSDHISNNTSEMIRRLLKT